MLTGRVHYCLLPHGDSVLVSVDRPLSSGHYMRTGAALKIQVELAHPLITPAALAAKEDLESTPQVSWSLWHVASGFLVCLLGSANPCNRSVSYCGVLQQVC